MSEPISMVQDFYIDSVSGQVSPWTVLFELGIVQPDAEGNPKTQSLLNVRMSPHHAKAFALLALGLIRSYEEDFGPLPLPDGRLRKNEVMIDEDNGTTMEKEEGTNGER